MISLKKHLDATQARKLENEPAAASGYRAAVLAMGKAGALAAPALGPALQRNLAALHAKISEDADPAVISDLDRRIVAELDSWGGRASEYFRQKTQQVKEILLLVARSAQSTGERDDRYAGQLTSFSSRLNAMAGLDDLTSMRRSLVQSALELKACADRMKEDSNETVAALQSELAVYRSLLAESEQVALKDALTGLANRRGIECEIEERIARGRVFCVILFDLNGFKQVNDLHGHLAGDDLLKQFGSELKNRFTEAGGVGRWGGDEFLVIADGRKEQAEWSLAKASEWLFGDYRVKAGEGRTRVKVSAAAGLAEWNGREDMAGLLKRADARMYQKKRIY